MIAVSTILWGILNRVGKQVPAVNFKVCMNDRTFAVCGAGFCVVETRGSEVVILYQGDNCTTALNVFTIGVGVDAR